MTDTSTPRTQCSNYAEIVAIHFALDGEKEPKPTTGWSNCYKRAVELRRQHEEMIDALADCISALAFFKRSGFTGGCTEALQRAQAAYSLATNK